MILIIDKETGKTLRKCVPGDGSPYTHAREILLARMQATPRGRRTLEQYWKGKVTEDRAKQHFFFIEAEAGWKSTQGGRALPEDTTMRPGTCHFVLKDGSHFVGDYDATNEMFTVPMAREGDLEYPPEKVVEYFIVPEAPHEKA